MQLVERVLATGLGSILIWLGVFVYEDEQKKIQTRLERAWVWLHDRSLIAMRFERSFLSRWAGAISRSLDALFGTKLLSLRAVIASSALSLCVACPIAIYSTSKQKDRWSTTFYIGLWLSCLLTVCLSRKYLRTATFLWSFIIVGLVFGVVRWTTNVPLRESPLFVAFMVPSIAVDLLMIAGARGLARLGSKASSLIKSILYLLSLAALGGISVLVPAAMMPRSESFRFEAVGFLFALDLSDVLFFSAIALVTLLIMIHHLLWPFILRALYAVQTSGVIANKKFNISTGVCLLSWAALPDKAHVKALIEIFQKFVE